MSPYSQVLGSFPYKKDNQKKKIIALTFDDGPNEPYTSEIVDYLDSQKIKATFFQVGKAVAMEPKLTKRMFDTGHLIGNHSQNHRFLYYFTQPSFHKELQESQAVFKRIIGKEPALFRPPWLFKTPLLLRTVKKMNLFPVSGLFCSNIEVFHASPNKIAKTAVARAQPGGILIFHDGYNGKGAIRKETVQSVALTVEALKADGYSFVTIDELFDIKPYK
jgi:peptidoglycan/xylan/chitin deacetylase (PgdA/CDA1 family)